MQENSPLLQLQNVGYLAVIRRFLITSIFRCVLANLSYYRSFWLWQKYTAKNSCFIDSPTSGTLLFEGEDVSTLKPESTVSKSLTAPRRRRCLAIRLR